MTPTVIIIVCFALAAFFISLAVTFTLTKRTASRKLAHKLQDFAREAVEDYKSYDYVLSGHMKVIDRDNMKRDESFDENCYLVGFKPGECAVCRCEVKKGNLIVEKPTVYSKDNLSEVKIRYMRTNAVFYDKSGKPAAELTVPQLTTKEIFEEFPVNIDQSDEALKFYDFLEDFAKTIG